MSSTRSRPGRRDDAHLASRRRQAERVLDEVRHDLQHAIGVCDCGRGAVGDGAQADAERISLRLVAANRVVGDFGEIDLRSGAR